MGNLCESNSPFTYFMLIPSDNKYKENILESVDNMETLKLIGALVSYIVLPFTLIITGLVLVFNLLMHRRKR
jgi:hypothetical protein